MATFYVLPSPAFLGKSFEPHLRLLFPGLNWDETALVHLAKQVSTALAQHPNVYLLHQHELTEGADVVQATVDGFGAESGDEVIEMHAGSCLRRVRGPR